MTAPHNHVLRVCKLSRSRAFEAVHIQEARTRPSPSVVVTRAILCSLQTQLRLSVLHCGSVALLHQNSRPIRSDSLHHRDSRELTMTSGCSIVDIATHALKRPRRSRAGEQDESV
mmetsp:Transcript_28998/g.46780  ORF Transcript_28998/g.46780 Transcript_28998/m.46780 type:complete len:115 (-) Transcript_28998:146-490(-)